MRGSRKPSGEATETKLFEAKKRMKNLIARLVREDAGQDLIEYALLGSFVSLVALTGATYLGNQLNLWYTGIGNVVNSATTGLGS
jgi:Flp pilus assembly pilin Flp